MEMRRLYRSRTNRWIAGVCGGIGEYFNIDPLIIRILAVVIPGFGWLAYLICVIIIPTEY
jgi:phage shock protein C